MLAAGCLLAISAIEVLSRPQPGEAEPYHARVRQVAEQMPLRFGDWVGTDQMVTESAVDLLKPNVILSRRFINLTDGRSVGFLLVHCKDARDILGHYPPNCYPSQGMDEIGRTATSWTIEGVRIPGVVYQFASRAFGSADLIVHNFILLPDGRIVRDMQAVNDHAADYLRRFYGAAQVQVVFSDLNLPAAEREEIFNSMIRVHLPVIEAIRTGVGL